MTDACNAVKKGIGITDCMNAKHQQQAATNKRRIVWERGLVVRPMETHAMNEETPNTCNKNGLAQSAPDE